MYIYIYMFKGLKIKWNGVQKKTYNKPKYSLLSENETSNNEIDHTIFEESHRKGGAKCKHEVFGNAPRSFRVSTSGAGLGR